MVLRNLLKAQTSLLQVGHLTLQYKLWIFQRKASDHLKQKKSNFNRETKKSSYKSRDTALQYSRLYCIIVYLFKFVITYCYVIVQLSEKIVLFFFFFFCMNDILFLVEKKSLSSRRSNITKERNNVFAQFLSFLFFCLLKINVKKIASHVLAGEKSMQF